MQEAVAKECAGLRWGDFKPRLADSIVAHLAPVQERYEEVTRDPSVLEQVLPLQQAWVHRHTACREGDDKHGHERGLSCSVSLQVWDASAWS